MAKSAQGFPVSRGSGNNLSLFSLASARLRETAIIADSDGAGEALHVELPAHDSPDRGSPLKIGGRAQTSPFAAVSEADRTDAWFTPNGQLGTIATDDPAYVYDFGLQVVNSVSVQGVSHGGTIVPIQADKTIKVLAAYFQCVTFGAIGTLGLAGSATAFFLARVTAINQNFALPPSPYAQYYNLGAGNDLELFYSGTGTFDVTCVYYLTPGA